LREKSRPGRTVTVRVRFADLRSVTRSVTLDAPISATAILAEIAEEFVRTALADHPCEKTISLLAISVCTSSNTGTCNWSSRSGSRMKSVGPAPRDRDRAGPPTAPYGRDPQSLRWGIGYGSVVLGH
jgi:DNA polymerase-4